MLPSDGSSPRVWGQARLEENGKIIIRIIPTRVGTSQIAQFVNAISKDHPHACGDKVTYDVNEAYQTGSSPRVWGQVFPRPFQVESTGIIPTRVGTRRSEKL